MRTAGVTTIALCTSGSRKGMLRTILQQVSNPGFPTLVSTLEISCQRAKNNSLQKSFRCNVKDRKDMFISQK